MSRRTRFKVVLTPTFQRDLEALPKQGRQRVLAAIKRLELEPFRPPPKIKKQMLAALGSGDWRCGPTACDMT